MLFSIENLKKETVNYFPDVLLHMSKLPDIKFKTLAFLYCFLLDKSKPLMNKNVATKLIAEELQENLIITISTLNYSLN